jgi:hypothetical protein
MDIDDDDDFYAPDEAAPALNDQTEQKPSAKPETKLEQHEDLEEGEEEDEDDEEDSVRFMRDYPKEVLIVV